MKSKKYIVVSLLILCIIGLLAFILIKKPFNILKSPQISSSASDELGSEEEARQLNIPIIEGAYIPDDAIVTNINGKKVTFGMLKKFNDIINSVDLDIATQSDLHDPEVEGFTIEEMKQIVEEYNDFLE